VTTPFQIQCKSKAIRRRLDGATNADPKRSIASPPLRSRSNAFSFAATSGVGVKIESRQIEKFKGKELSVS
jgi:hypothetical protein